jgi:ribosomal protein L11 methyltransferase
MRKRRLRPACADFNRWEMGAQTGMGHRDATGGWIRLEVTAPAAEAEAAADFLTGLTGRGVETASAGEGLEKVTGYLAQGPAAAEQERAVRGLVERLRAQEPRVRLSVGRLADQDWGANWKRHFRPLELAPGLWVAPPWEAAPPGPGEVVVIDPGQAFGTGHHASTALCLRRLARLAREGRLAGDVLDVGCGTGILSLAALRLGAAKARSIDTDPQALEAARANAELNGLSAWLEVSATPLAEVAGSYPLVLANLTAETLRALAPELAARVAPGGELVASGILEDQVDEVRELLARAGLEPRETGARDEWRSLVMGR